MKNSYASLLISLPQTIAEEAAKYEYVTERHLQAIWFEQKYFKNLISSKGERIEVISPGIWNAEAGPDFKKAHLKIGQLEIKGDVEIHLNDESWQQHQHHLDDRYDQVIFHLSLWKPHSEKTLTTKSGQEIILGHLEDYLTVPLNRILQLIDLDLYPYKKFIGSGRCAQTLFRTLPQEKIQELFKGASEWRLVQKRRYLKARMPTSKLQLAAGIAMALGYKNNAEAFLDLFLWMHQLPYREEDQFMAKAMQACGFFSETYCQKWQHSQKFGQLQKIAQHLVGHPFHVKLALNQIRPYNHPIRRLAILAKLVTDRNQPELLVHMFDMWNKSWEACKDKKHWKELSTHLCSLLPSYQDAYWNSHYVFEDTPKEGFLTLLGENIKQEILVNAFLPFLQEYVEQQSDPWMTKAFYDFYACFPASQTGKTKYLIHRFFGDTAKGNIMDHAIMEQGAYQLHRDFCIHFEASCAGCPFVDRYKSKFQ